MISTKVLRLAGIAVALLPGLSFAQDSKNQGYLVDAYGNNISTSPNTGLCWRTSDWTPARAVAHCDPVAAKVEAPAPSVVTAAAPSPKPAATPAPVTRPAPQSVSFSADALFAFDKAELKPEGKTLLDDFASQLRGAQYETITVTGHTDRFGSNDYNQKLSGRRADSVKSYLVSKDIPAHRLNASGKGETQPVTQADDCKGGQSVKVIACLQPDRRVHVEVTGAKVLANNPR